MQLGGHDGRATPTPNARPRVGPTRVVVHTSMVARRLPTGPTASKRCLHPQPARPRRGPPLHAGSCPPPRPDPGSTGQHQEAQQLLNDTFTRSRRILGEDHPETLRTASLLGLTLGALDEHQRARQIQTDALSRLRRVLGDDHPETLTSASRLAADLRELGEYQRARALDEDALARRRRVLGDDHPDTLISANNLAADLHALGEHEQT